MSALQTSNAYLAQPAESAGQVSPKPVRNGLLAGVLGLVLGVGLAFLRETLDTRVRSTDEIASWLELPLLARVPSPPRHVRSATELVTIVEPNSAHAEAFRILRTNLDFVNLEAGARTIMFTSAGGGEGKSTTAANVAVAMARAGRRCVLVDLDLRQSSVHSFFRLTRDRGMTDVALGRIALEEAMVGVPLGIPARNGHRAGNGQAETGPMLVVVPAGTPPPNPGELVAGSRMATILGTLRERADIVIVDAPPLLSVGDALALSSRVDGMVLVASLPSIQRSALGELRRVLESCPARKLGFVLAGAELEQGYGYASYGAYHQPAPTSHPAGSSVGDQHDGVRTGGREGG
jgi:polysaccharide biosynthesis transport protein